MLVIDQADQRLLPGRVGQQAQHGQADQEPVRGGPGAQAERCLQRRTLRTRQPVQVIQKRLAQLLQPGERQLHLGLHARGTDHPAARGVPGHVVQQRRLAHPRLARQNQRPALARPDRTDQPVKETEFAAPAPQLHNAAPARRRCHHLTGTSPPTRRLATATGHWQMRAPPDRSQPVHHDALHLLQARPGYADKTATTHNREEPNPMPPSTDGERSPHVRQTVTTHKRCPPSPAENS